MAEHHELLDRLGGRIPTRDVAGTLRDIRRANRFFGGTRTVLNAVSPVMRALSAANSRPITVLDVATGSADIPLALVDLADGHGWDVRVVASDLQPDVLAFASARERAGRITIEQADALDLPYPDDAFDIVTLALALHHFEPGEAVRVLKEMRRVARHAMVVSDLERSHLGYAGAWLFGHLLTRNRLTRNDAPLSVRRAYTFDEARLLVSAAGWNEITSRRAFAFRLTMVGRP